MYVVYVCGSVVVVVVCCVMVMLGGVLWMVMGVLGCVCIFSSFGVVMVVLQVIFVLMVVIWLGHVRVVSFLVVLCV